MNFAKARLDKKEDGRIHVICEGCDIPVPDDKKEKLEPHVGKEIIFGIRPEDIQDMEFAREDLKVYNTKATVEVSEPLGSEVLFHVKFGENTFSARVDPHTKAKIGEQISLVFNMNKMHVFDTETEQNLIY